MDLEVRETRVPARLAIRERVRGSTFRVTLVRAAALALEVLKEIRGVTLSVEEDIAPGKTLQRCARRADGNKEKELEEGRDVLELA